MTVGFTSIMFSAIFSMLSAKAISEPFMIGM